MMIRKRDGRLVNYDGSKIIGAVAKAMKEVTGKVDKETCYRVEEEVLKTLQAGNYPLTVEGIQDSVVNTLMSLGTCNDVAVAYIEYKTQRDAVRGKEKKEVDSKFPYLGHEFLKQYITSSDPFPTELGKMVYYRTYSRPIPEEGRRERWWETVARVVNYSADLEIMAIRRELGTVHVHDLARAKKQAREMYDLMYNLKLFPSGRSLWIGGTKSAYENPIANFNCSFVAVDELKIFSEMFLVLMLGTGVGLSVQKKYIRQLPKINTNINVVHKDYTPVPKSQRTEFTQVNELAPDVLEIVIGDSKGAWSKAMQFYMEIVSEKLYNDINFIVMNYDNIRPAGEPLKTFGGTASGHNAIKVMFEKIDKVFKREKERQHKTWISLSPINALDIATSIAENVVSGGVRRSALIVFADEDEKDVLEAKNNLYKQEGDNWVVNQDIIHRQLANITILYENKPKDEQINNQFELIRFSGEPAFGNFEEMLRRRPDVQGGNPCFEILLKHRQVCNLTEINMMGFVKEDGTFDKDEMLKAQRYSALIGYRMATIELELHEWDKANADDRLTGVSLTGLMDFVNATKISREELIKLLQELRQVAHYTANELADYLGLKRPTLHTAIKPSGTISQLPTVSSGVHYSHSPYFIRRVRVNAQDPVAKALVADGFKWYPEVGQTEENHQTKVFEFPVKAPEGKTKYDVSAIEQLEFYKLIMEHYVDHNASNTIHVRDHEWSDVKKWVSDNWDVIVGVTFLSLDDSFYELLPYEAITKEEYEEMLAETPTFNPDTINQFEQFDVEFDVLDSDCDSGLCPVR